MKDFAFFGDLVILFRLPELKNNCKHIQSYFFQFLEKK